MKISKIFAFALLAFMASDAFAVQTGFRARVTKSEDCAQGFSACREQKTGLGQSCQISVEVTDNPGRLVSTQDSRGANHMSLGGAPKIEGGAIVFNGDIFQIGTGMQADVFKFGGPFSAFMGDTSGSSVGARVFFNRVNGIPKAYAAVIYVGSQAYRCGVVRQSR